MSLQELVFVVLGFVVIAGVGFLCWILYRLTLELHASGRMRRSR